MTTLPIFEVDASIDVHAPASTYYTTGDNARQRTRTYTVNISFLTELFIAMATY
jgi:hypothetical protein